MDSRLEKGIRAVAWAALAATVATLLSLGVWLQPPASAIGETNQTRTERVSAANAPAGPMEEVK